MDLNVTKVGKIWILYIFRGKEVQSNAVYSFLLVTVVFEKSWILVFLLVQFINAFYITCYYQVFVNVVHVGVGPISQSDLDWAQACGACIVGFNVRTPPTTVTMVATQAGIKVPSFYTLLSVMTEFRDWKETNDVSQVHWLVGGRRTLITSLTNQYTSATSSESPFWVTILSAFRIIVFP